MDPASLPDLNGPSHNDALNLRIRPYILYFQRVVMVAEDCRVIAWSCTAVCLHCGSVGVVKKTHLPYDITVKHNRCKDTAERLQSCEVQMWICTYTWTRTHTCWLRLSGLWHTPLFYIHVKHWMFMIFLYIGTGIYTVHKPVQSV